MQPSSLIFLVIIAIWAAYFIQYWVRRREHLATARSVDRFSESMRVLERRRALPEPDLAVPQPRSYAVSPARAARAQVLVKRAEPAATPVPPTSGSGAAKDASRGGFSSRRMRGLAFLGSFALLLAAIPLATFSLIPWLGLVAPGAACGGSFLWLRRGAALAAAARRQAAADHRGAGEARRAKASGPTRPAAPADTPADSGDRVFAEPTPGAENPSDSGCPSTRSEDGGRRRAGQPYDIAAVEGRSADAAAPARQAASPAPAGAPSVAATAHQQPARPLVDEDDIPLTWDPVPVPRPTYTMKAKAERPHAPRNGATEEQHGEHTAYEPPHIARAVGG